jgi:hypothetical protein
MVSYRARAKRRTVLILSNSCRTLNARHWGGRTLQSNKRVIEFHFSFFFISFIKLQVNKKLKRSSWNDIQITLPVTVLKNLAKQTKKIQETLIGFFKPVYQLKKSNSKRKNLTIETNFDESKRLPRVSRRNVHADFAVFKKI